MKYPATLLISCLLMSMNLIGQENFDPSDFEKINQFYAQQEQFRIEAEVRLFPNHTAEQFFEKEKTSLQRNGKNLLHRIDDIETLTTADLRISADHADRTITMDALRQPLPTQLTQIDLAASLSNCSKTAARTEGTLKICRLDFRSGELEALEVRFQNDSYQLERLVLFYRTEEKLETGKKSERPRVEIVYLRHDLSPKFDTGVFSVERFLKKTANGWQLADHRRGYKFYNLLKK